MLKMAFELNDFPLNVSVDLEALLFFDVLLVLPVHDLLTHLGQLYLLLFLHAH